jgi:hypothetical protein
LKNDEEESEAVIVEISSQMIQDFELASKKTADSLIAHYNWICPAVMVGYKEKEQGLDHHRLKNRLDFVDRIKFKYKTDMRSPKFKDGKPKVAGASHKDAMVSEVAKLVILKEQAELDRLQAELERAQAKVEREAIEKSLATAAEGAAVDREAIERARAASAAAGPGDMEARVQDLGEQLKEIRSVQDSNQGLGAEALQAASQERQVAEDMLRKVREETQQNLNNFQQLLTRSTQQVQAMGCD